MEEYRERNVKPPKCVAKQWINLYLPALEAIRDEFISFPFVSILNETLFFSTLKSVSKRKIFSNKAWNDWKLIRNIQNKLEGTLFLILRNIVFIQLAFSTTFSDFTGVYVKIFKEFSHVF